MHESVSKTGMQKKLNLKVLIAPVLVMLAGAILFIVCVPLTEEENTGTVIAFFLL